MSASGNPPPNPQEKSSMDAEIAEVDEFGPTNATIRISHITVSTARVGITDLDYDDVPEEFKEHLPGKSGDPNIPDAPVFEIILPDKSGQVKYSHFIDGYFVETEDGYGAVSDLIIDGEYKLDINRNPVGPKIRRGLFYSIRLLRQKQTDAIIEAAEKTEKEKAKKFGLLDAQEEEEKKRIAYEKASKEYNEAQTKKLKIAADYHNSKLIESEVKMTIPPPSPLTPAVGMDLQSQSEDVLSQLDLLENASSQPYVPGGDEEEEVPSNGQTGGPAALGTVTTTQQESSTETPVSQQQPTASVTAPSGVDITIPTTATSAPVVNVAQTPVLTERQRADLEDIGEVQPQVKETSSSSSEPAKPKGKRATKQKAPEPEPESSPAGQELRRSTRNKPAGKGRTTGRKGKGRKVTHRRRKY